MKLKRYCFALDLKKDERLIAEYEEHHRKVSDYIIRSIKKSGIHVMDIYRVQNRLFMIMEVDENFSFENKKQLDENDPLVQEWETLMLNYQQPLPNSEKGEKWLLMKQIFSL